jgi:hypothetical protein
MRVPSSNGTRSPIAPEPTREEAAAIIAAVERFMRATAPRAHTERTRDGEEWREAALLEAVERWPQENLGDPWINT